MTDEEALLLLKQAFPNWDFVSKGVEHAKERVNAKDPIFDRYPIFSVSNGYSDYAPTQIATALLHLGADLNKGSEEGWAPIHYYIRAYAFAMVEWLVENNAIINIAEVYGKEDLKQTPLILLVLNNAPPSTVAKLIINGANPLTEDLTGKNALDYAKQGKRYGLLEVIEKEKDALQQAHPSAQPQTKGSRDLSSLNMSLF